MYGRTNNSDDPTETGFLDGLMEQLDKRPGKEVRGNFNGRVGRQVVDGVVESNGNDN